MASTLSTAERRLLRAQWLQSGRCLRCFHSSRSRSAAEKTLSPRRQRAAAVSSEVENLATQAPSAPPSKESARSTPRPRSASKRAETDSPNQKNIKLDELLRLGEGTSTLAGGNLRGVLVDKIRQAARPALSKDQYFGDVKSLQRRSVMRSLTAFVDSSEKQSYQTQTHRALIKPPPEKVAQDITDKLLLGKHQGGDVLNGQEKHKQPILNDVARAMLLNSSYAAKDAERFFNKVRGLIPAAVAPKKAARAS